MSTLDRNQKNQLKQEYKQRSKRMGAFQIRNLSNGKVLVGTSNNLDSMFNRYRFTLDHGMESNKELQADWNQYGAEQFAFEVIELLKDEGQTPNQIKRELEEMENRLLLSLDQSKMYQRKNT